MITWKMEVVKYLNKQRALGSSKQFCVSCFICSFLVHVHQAQHHSSSGTPLIRRSLKAIYYLLEDGVSSNKVYHVTGGLSRYFWGWNEALAYNHSSGVALSVLNFAHICMSFHARPGGCLG